MSCRYLWLISLSLLLGCNQALATSQVLDHKLVDLSFESSGTTAGYCLEEPIVVANGFGHPNPDLVDRYLWENSQLKFEFNDTSPQSANSISSEESKLAKELVIGELTNGVDDELAFSTGIGGSLSTFIEVESCLFSTEPCEIGYGPSNITLDRDLFGYHISEIAITNIEFSKNWFNNKFPCRTGSGCTEYAVRGSLEIHGRAIQYLIGDADSDGLGDLIDSDDDNDGLTDDLDPDDDNDGFTDEEELADGTNPLSRFSCRSGCFRFDIDENSEAKALTDGLLVIRHLFGFTGDALATGAISTDATRDRAEDISALLADADSELDIDGNGESKALSDGLLLIRYLFGFTGDALTVGAIGEGATRDTSEAIEAYISDRVPASE